jgi:hypothetical protein
VVGFWLVDINCYATTHYTLGMLGTIDEDDKFRTRTLLFQHHVVCSIGLDDLHSFAEVPSPISPHPLGLITRTDEYWFDHSST